MYHLSPAEVDELPAWEADLLAVYARQLLGGPVQAGDEDARAGDERASARDDRFWDPSTQVL